MAHYEQDKEASRALEGWILRFDNFERDDALLQYAEFIDGTLGLARVFFKQLKLDAKTVRLMERERVFVITNRVTAVRDDEPSTPSPSRERDLCDLPPSCKAKATLGVFFFVCMAKQGSYYHQDRINFGWIDSKLLQVDPGGQGRDTSTPPLLPHMTDVTPHNKKNVFKARADCRRQNRGLRPYNKVLIEMPTYKKVFFLWRKVLEDRKEKEKWGQHRQQRRQRQSRSGIEAAPNRGVVEAAVIEGQEQSRPGSRQPSLWLCACCVCPSDLFRAVVGQRLGSSCRG